jgi:hypothetical protein
MPHLYHAGTFGLDNELPAIGESPAEAGVRQDDLLPGLHIYSSFKYWELFKDNKLNIIIPDSII